MQGNHLFSNMLLSYILLRRHGIIKENVAIPFGFIYNDTQEFVYYYLFNKETDDE